MGFNPCSGLFNESGQTMDAESDYVGNVLGPAQALIQNAARKQYGPNASTKQTFCNQATCAIASAMGAPMGPLQDASGAPYSANDMAANLAESSAYRAVGPAEAQLLADEGKLVIGARANPDGHGHVVTVRPEGVPGDTPVGHSGPLVNDIGTNDQVDRRSAAFRNNQHVVYYTPSGGGGQ